MTLKDKLKSLPASPGCYLMKGVGGKVIYVGKAKVLKNRVRSYFQKGTDLSRRIRQMVGEVSDIETIATDSELEALILESNLIKKHHPTYNVRLRDDKSYPYIAITLSEEWPRPVFMRKLRMQRKEKDKYFGPYTDSEAVRETLRIIRRVFRVPCGYKDPSQSKDRACLYYHINQCTGVCRGAITKDEYMEVIRDVMAFLEGRREQLAQRLLAQMEEAAENLEFEKAAKIRDQVQSIQTLIARQKVISTALEDQDVIALVTDDGNTIAEMFFVRGGKLIGQEHFMLENASADELSASLLEFIKQYYDTAAYVPREVLLNADIDEIDIIETWLRQKKGTKVTIASPKRGEKKQLIEMACKNAELVLKQLRLKMETDEVRIREQMEALQEALGLDRLPNRIEAYDISNIQGFDQVASLVVFENGRPKKEHYRKFKIRREDGIPDDYASMREVVSRRLTGKLRETQAFEELPDLMLIDGGKGQLNAALEAIREAEAPSPRPSPQGEGEPQDETPSPQPSPQGEGEWGLGVIGLAKQREEVFLPGRPEPILLPRDSTALHLIQRVRDEAHRFAITYHRGIRGKAMRASVLNNISGVGPKRRRALVRHFGSVERIKNASIHDLAAAPAMTKTIAEKIHEYFRSKEDQS